MGFLGPKAFEAVLGILTGGTSGGTKPTPFRTYRSGTEIESFLRKCGVDFHLRQFESRVPGARRALVAVNGDPDGFAVITEIVETLVHEHADGNDPSEMVEYLNRRLSSDGLCVVNRGESYVLVRMGEDTELIEAVDEAVDWLDWDSVRSEVSRAREHIVSDPEDAVTAACSIVESICKCLLDEMGKPYPNKQDICGLVREVSRHLDLSPGQKDLPADIKQILSGLVSVTAGVGALRTHGGDAHGRGRGESTVDPRTARLAVHAASAISLFYVETWNTLVQHKQTHGKKTTKQQRKQ